MELDRLTLSDGRGIDVGSVGPAAGGVVVLQHGLPASRLGVAHAEEAAIGLGVRVVSVSRPGFGGTDVADPGLAARGQDMIEVADVLGIDQFAVLGISGGAPFAAAAAVAGPERVTALGIGVGMGPWNELDPADDPALQEERALLALDAAGCTDEALAAYRTLAATWFGGLVALESDEDLMRTFIAMNADEDGVAAEDTTFMTPQMRGRFARDLREALTSYDGIALDNISTGRRWDIDVSAIRQPTHLWYGEADAVVSMDHARWWQSRIPHAHLTVRSGEGHGSTFLLHWEEMLRALVP